MIRLEGVVKKFDSFTALDGIDLTIPAGCAYGLLGSNGAGKSTILRLVAGIYKPEQGRVLIGDQEAFENVPLKEQVFFVNDETVQFNTFTLYELKEFYKTFYPKFSEEYFTKLWSVLQLPMNRRISSFSKGMKRQAVVICGIACRPQYLLLDEAFDGLDPTMRIIVKNMLVDAMFDSNLTVIFSSHNLKEIDEFCSQVSLLHKGKIVFNRELDTLKGNIHKIQTAFNENYTKEDFAELDVLHFSRSGSVVYLIAKGDTEQIHSVLVQKNAKFIDMIPLSLEEIFIYEMEGLGYDHAGI